MNIRTYRIGFNYDSDVKELRSTQWLRFAEHYDSKLIKWNRVGDIV